MRFLSIHIKNANRKEKTKHRHSHNMMIKEDPLIIPFSNLPAGRLFTPTL
jgi:hypothetical protein